MPTRELAHPTAGRVPEPHLGQAARARQPQRRRFDTRRGRPLNTGGDHPVRCWIGTRSDLISRTAQGSWATRPTQNSVVEPSSQEDRPRVRNANPPAPVCRPYPLYLRIPVNHPVFCPVIVLAVLPALSPLDVLANPFTIPTFYSPAGPPVIPLAVSPVGPSAFIPFVIYVLSLVVAPLVGSLVVPCFSAVVILVGIPSATPIGGSAATPVGGSVASPSEVSRGLSTEIPAVLLCLCLQVHPRTRPWARQWRPL